jgi:hypothetical protein
VSIVKYDNEVKNNGVARKETSSLIIGQQGEINIPGNVVTLNATNVAHIAISRVDHEFPYTETVSGESRYQSFEKPPIIMASISNGAIYHLDSPYYTSRQYWTPFDAKSTVWNDGTTIVEESRFSIVTPKYIYFCTLTVRRSGTYTGLLGGGTLYYYMMFPTSTSLTGGDKGGPGTPTGTYCLYDYYTYNKYNELQRAITGSFELGSGTMVGIEEIDSPLIKYDDILSTIDIPE